MLLNFLGLKNVQFVKSRHSRAGGNPECINILKRLDSRFHGNDGKIKLRTFCKTIKYGFTEYNFYLRLSAKICVRKKNEN